MPVKDCATLEAEIAKDEPSRLLIEIALRQPLPPLPLPRMMQPKFSGRSATDSAKLSRRSSFSG